MLKSALRRESTANRTVQRLQARVKQDTAYETARAREKEKANKTLQVQVEAEHSLMAADANLHTDNTEAHTSKTQGQGAAGWTKNENIWDAGGTGKTQSNNGGGSPKLSASGKNISPEATKLVDVAKAKALADKIGAAVPQEVRVSSGNRGRHQPE